MSIDDAIGRRHGTADGSRWQQLRRRWQPGPWSGDATALTVLTALLLLLGLVIYTGAFIAEIVRGSIQAVPRGQKEAAEALGLTPRQQLRLVVWHRDII